MFNKKEVKTIKCSKMNILILFVFVNIVLPCTATSCLLPLTEGLWYSSSRGTWIVTNNASTSNIHNFEARLTLQKTYTLECINSTDTKYIFRTTVYLFGYMLDLYTCIDITQEQISPDVFLFYIVTPLDVTGERFTVKEQEVCNHSNYKTAVNAHLIIRPGFEMASSISCPTILNGIFDVTFGKADGNITNEIEMDSCTDEKLMVFTNETPNSTLGFTNDNILHCLYSATSGTKVYLHTYNSESSVDNVNTFRFACWVIEKGRNQTTATVSPNKCVIEQNSTSVPSGGQTVVFTSKDSCGELLCSFYTIAVTFGAAGLFALSCLYLFYSLLYGFVGTPTKNKYIPEKSRIFGYANSTSDVRRYLIKHNQSAHIAQLLR